LLEDKTGGRRKQGIPGLRWKDGVGLDSKIRV